jgi:hypothetical protein
MMRSLAAGLLIAAAAACGSRPAAAPASPAAIPAPAPPRPVNTLRDITVCVVQHGQLQKVTAQYEPATGDTTFGRNDWGMPVRDEYAAGAAWFVNGEPIPRNGYNLVKYGPERVLPMEHLVRAGEHGGVPVFREEGVRSGMIFVPVRMGCVFQPYHVDYTVGAVRGG